MPQRATPRPGGGAPRIDWAAAYAHFERDATCTFGDVARKFGVSDTAVRKHARPGADYPEGWLVRRAETIATAAAANRRRNVRAYAERMADDIELLDELRALALQAARSSTIEIGDVLRAITRLLPFERLYEGESTGHIKVTDAQAEYGALVDAFQEFVDDTSGTKQERRDRFLAKMAALPALQAAAQPRQAA